MKYFSADEFRCSCGCQGNAIDPELASALDEMRGICGFPFIVTSGYRCHAHNTAIGGHKGSAHCIGMAVDISASGSNALHIIAAALLTEEITGVGISQKGSGRFIHLDNAHTKLTCWSY